jgi:signal transduction histidine kinase
MRIDAICDRIKKAREMLVLLIYRFSIRSILFAGFCLVIVLGVFMTGLTEWTEDRTLHAFDRFVNVDNELSDICLKSMAAMGNARRNEKDFVLNYRDFGYDEAKSRYISRALMDIADIEGFMEKLRLGAGDPEVTRQAAQVEQAIGEYRQKLLVVVDKYGTIGSYSSGLEGAFRDTAHEMEALLERHGNDRLMADLLSMRRREKDFIMRNRDLDDAEFDRDAARFVSDVAASGLSPQLKKRLGKLAGEYRSLFAEYARVIEEIRSAKSDYLKSVQLVEPTLEKLHIHLDGKFRETFANINNSDRLFGVIKAGTGILALLVSLVVAAVISTIISKSVDESRAFAEQVAAGNLEDRLAPRGKNEFTALASAMNGMAESLQTADVAREKWMAELIESKRRLADKARDLARSNAELEQFAYAASHDLQEPLRMVASYVQLLECRYKGKLDSEADEFIAYALEGALRMKKLIDDLLALSRVGVVDRAPKPVECEAVLGQVLRDLREKIDEHGAVITHDPMPVVVANGRELARLFAHLIDNAIKFRGAEPPCIHVGVDKTNAECRFCVRDNGIGLAPEHFDRIFRLFQRLNSRERYPGTGIGLAECKKIVERYGGRIWVESEPGAGATFYFTLPRDRKRSSLSPGARG